jgi:hypothetical protein
VGSFDFKMLIQGLSAYRHWPVPAAGVATARLTMQTSGKFQILFDIMSKLAR